MIHWVEATVTRIISLRPCLQELQVQTDEGGLAKALHYTDVLPQLELGDRVLLNTTAVDLNLGTGGVHFVHSIIAPESRLAEVKSHPSNGHIIKLRYTPLQRKVLAAEAPESPYHHVFAAEQQLEGMPVLIGELHSMLPIAVSWMRRLGRQQGNLQPAISYIMSEGGALPIQFSHHVSTLSTLDWIDGTITYGHAYGGELETINKYTALIAAKHIQKANISIVTLGPGIVGTGTLLGHSGVEVIELINAVHLLGGKPVVIPRISFADIRKRHTGISHHQLYTLSKLADKQVILALPDRLPAKQMNHLEQQIKAYQLDQKHQVKWMSGLSVNQISESMREYPLQVRTMGRGLVEDEAFFFGVCAAAEYAWEEYVRLQAESTENPLKKH